MSSTKTEGFSLIELLIVVAIIGIIASIAIPHLLATRRAANEGSATQSLRTIHSCQLIYQATTGRGNFGDLNALRVDLLTDHVLGSGAKSGYTFVVNPTPPGVRPALYYTTAVPITPAGLGATGTRRFGVCEDGLLHGDTGGGLVAYADETAVKNAPSLGN